VSLGRETMTLENDLSQEQIERIALFYTGERPLSARAEPDPSDTAQSHQTETNTYEHLSLTRPATNPE
jgi:hypothetical protein